MERNPIRLGVNIDHVATVRQARRTVEPDPVAAAVLAVLGGADSITIHLREDRRHIQDRDLRILRETIPQRLNLEMACVGSIADIACQVKPDQVTLVPERREELTTEGGLDGVGQKRFAGTFTSREGKLTLRMPGSGVDATVDIVWRGNGQFAFTIRYSDGPTEFTARRR